MIGRAATGEEVRKEDHAECISGGTPRESMCSFLPYSKVACVSCGLGFRAYGLGFMV